MPSPCRLLFIGPARAGLHRMAAAMMREFAPPRAVEATAAGSSAGTLDTEAEAAARSAGLDLAAAPDRRIADLGLPLFHVVIVIGPQPADLPPDVLGMPARLHWALELPEPDAPPVLRRAGYTAALSDVRRRLADLTRSGLLGIVGIGRKRLQQVLDSLDHAVMAHTLDRTVFAFSRAAERLTGLSREDVVGRDCHAVFAPRRFCGGQCAPCNGLAAEGGGLAERQPRTVPFVGPDGVERLFAVVARPYHDESGESVGSVVSFSEVTAGQRLPKWLGRRRTFHGFVTVNPGLLEMFARLGEAAQSDVSVLVQGETGTGKELIARALHAESRRDAGPFVAVNCGALPDGVFESEMFGHVRGAFTGAVRDRKGRFELANRGTLFLDEVAELSPTAQAKLLRALQEGRIERVGGERPLPTDARIVAATNQNLRELAEQGRFRRDLYYRLAVLTFQLPPLRERRLDIPVLVDDFLHRIGSRRGHEPLFASAEAIERLVAYPWPGNVRELYNVLEQVHLDRRCQSGRIDAECLPDELRAPAPTERAPAARSGPPRKLDPQLVLRALAETGGNRRRAAELLRVGRTTVYRYLASIERA